MQSKFLIVALLLVAVATASRKFITRTDSINADYADFYVQGKAVPANVMHTVHIAIKQKKDAMQACDSLINDISNPESKNYGRFLSLEESKSLFTDLENTRAVQAWLKVNKIPYKTSLSGDFITVTTEINKIERLLNTKYYYFHSTLNNKIIRRADSYSLPTSIAQYIDFVSHTINFPPHKTRFLHESVKQSGSVTPQTLNTVYGIDSNTVTNQGANQSLFEALGQDFSPADLATFQQQYNLPNFAVGQVIGPNDPSQCSSNPNNCGEANLDVQYLMALAQMSPTTYWSIDPNANDPFVDWIVALGNTAYPPLVHSMSYGSIAKEDDSHDILRFNQEACELGVRGLTIVVASGDDGVANFLARNNQSACGFSPSWPATSQYVLTVGATQGPESGQPEIACSSSTGGIITTGGGFSIYYSRPSWQADAVQNYLNSAPNLPPLSMFSSSNRAYPDVSILGYNFNVVLGGNTYQESGTSAAAPSFAALITLINNARMNAGKSPLGFVTPALYKLQQQSNNLFNDITVGENNCCAGQVGQIICCQYGFNATTGWDPLTGLGSPRYQNLKSALTSI